MCSVICYLKTLYTFSLFCNHSTDYVAQRTYSKTSTICVLNIIYIFSSNLWSPCLYKIQNLWGLYQRNSCWSCWWVEISCNDYLCWHGNEITVKTFISFSKKHGYPNNNFRDWPFMPQGRLLQRGMGIGYPGSKLRLFATRQLIQLMHSITALIVWCILEIS